MDGGKARIILNALVTPSEVTENRPMLDLLWSTVFRWRIHPRQVTGDAKYGTRENVAALEKAGIRAYVAIPNFDFRDTGLFGPGHFRYDPENDHYLCPAGQTLRFQNKDHHNRRKRYRAKPSVCNACELKGRCTTSERGRVLYRPFEEDFYDRVRAYRGTFPYAKALRKRKVVGGAFVRRGQRLARDEEVPTAEAREGKHRSFADRLRPKRQAAARLRRPETEEAGSGSGPTSTGRRPRDLSRSGASFKSSLAAKEGIFQQCRSFSEHNGLTQVIRRAVE